MLGTIAIAAIGSALGNWISNGALWRAVGSAWSAIATALSAVWTWLASQSSVPNGAVILVVLLLPVAFVVGVRWAVDERAKPDASEAPAESDAPLDEHQVAVMTLLGEEYPRRIPMEHLIAILRRRGLSYPEAERSVELLMTRELVTYDHFMANTRVLTAEGRDLCIARGWVRRPKGVG